MLHIERLFFLPFGALYNSKITRTREQRCRFNITSKEPVEEDRKQVKSCQEEVEEMAGTAIHKEEDQAVIQTGKTGIFQRRL